MPEFNDRRPRTKMRVQAKNVLPGDHVDFGDGVHHEVKDNQSGPIPRMDPKQPNMVQRGGQATRSGAVIHLNDGKPPVGVTPSKKVTVHRLSGAE